MVHPFAPPALFYRSLTLLYSVIALLHYAFAPSRRARSLFCCCLTRFHCVLALPRRASAQLRRVLTLFRRARALSRCAAA